MSAGDVHSLEGRIERAEDRADAAIVDVRGLARLQREFHRETMARLDTLELRLDRIESTLAAQGRALNSYLGAFEAKLQVRVTAAQLVLLLLQCMRTWEYRVAGSLARCFPGAGHNAASMGVRPQHS